MDGGSVGGRYLTVWEAPRLSIIHHQCFPKAPDAPIPQKLTNLPSGYSEYSDVAQYSKLAPVHSPRSGDDTVDSSGLTPYLRTYRW